MCLCWVQAAGLTELIHIFLVGAHLVRVRDNIHVFVLADGGPAFGEDDEFVPRDVVRLNRLSDDLFGFAIRVIVGRVPLRLRSVLR